MRIAAVVLARGGSKGIPRKNLRKIGGREIVARAADLAASATFDEVFVYSDDPEILGVVRRTTGATAVERPAEVSGDDATSEDTMARFVRDVDAGGRFDWFGLLQCTTPFLRRESLDEALEKARSGRFDTVVTVTDVVRFLAYSGGYPQREFVPVYPYRSMRQHFAGKLFMENGGLYLSKRDVWFTGRRYGGAVGVVRCTWWESLEIDEPIDLAVAQAIEPVMREEP